MERPLRGLLLLWLASAVLTAAGCRAQATPTAGPTPAIGPTQTATLAPTEEAPVVEQATATTAAVEGDVTEMATQTQAATQPAVTQPAPVSQPVPDPSLFEMSWQERGPFQAGLLDGAEAALEELQAASVYHMDLELSNDLTQLAGRQEVFYTNREDVPLEEVYLRLFPNLADGRTTINATWVNGIEVQPNFELEDSAMRVPMQPALPPGQSVMLRFDFAVEIPTEGGGNYGTFVFNEDILALAHFYPMVAVYDDEGWNLEIAPESGDVVYADSSFYVVRLRAPAGLQLVASGLEVAGGGSGEQQQVTFAAGPARDFYLAGSEGFAVYSEQVGATIVNSYAFPEFEPAARDVLDWASSALQTFNEQFGQYPYSELDLVTTPTLALGVEYPGVIAINMTLYDMEESRYPAAVLESTVAHEVAHQWFYGVVGNDQLDDPWLDESLTQYATLLYAAEAGETVDAAGFRQSLVQRWEAVDSEEIPIGMPVEAYGGPQYSAIVYGRGPLFFEALAQEMGADTFEQFLRDYYQTFKWGIATPQELQALAEQDCGCELDSLFEQWVYGG